MITFVVPAHAGTQGAQVTVVYAAKLWVLWSVVLRCAHLCRDDVLVFDWRALSTSGSRPGFAFPAVRFKHSGVTFFHRDDGG